MSQKRRKSVAFVTPRYGAEIYGGAEHLCRRFAERLATTHDVCAISTCARDYRTWRDEYAPGESLERGVTVRRFRVDRPRDPNRFDRLSSSVCDAGGQLTLAAQEAWMREQGPYSSSLLRFLESEQSRFDAFVFAPYLYATTYFGLPVVAERSILMPLAHAEWMLELSAWDAVFAGAKRRVFVSDEERALVVERFGPQISGEVISAGVDSMPGDAARFHERTGVARPFALYVGRIDASKGCDRMLLHFEAYRRATTGSALGLVMVGPGTLLSAPTGVVQLGPVDEQLKWDAYAACSLFVMPSGYESLSFALLEAWSAGKPALVNAQAKVLVEHCRRSNGGLWYQNAAEFSAAIHVLEAEGPRLGRQGRTYVENCFSWEASCAALAETIDAISAGHASP